MRQTNVNSTVDPGYVISKTALQSPQRARTMPTESQPGTSIHPFLRCFLRNESIFPHLNSLFVRSCV
jgi:hypothetical protein